VSEAARILQAGLVGARDTAINNNAPAGIRLLPDRVFNGINPSTNALDPTRILASNRFVPIQLAADYTEGFVRVDLGPPTLAYTAAGVNPAIAFPYPATKGGGFYPAGSTAMLYIEQQFFDQRFPTTDVPNPPTSWYWNVRIGDRIQLNNTGIYYTVVGPMNVFNSELFVNVGDPGTTPPLQRTGNGGTIYHPEILFLLNGQDDNHDGYIDNGWDGLDNDGDGIVDRAPDFTIPNLFEWVEVEKCQDKALLLSVGNVPYTITRRPTVAPGGREILLPSNVVVDLTLWNPLFFGAGYTSERSRLPVDATTGSVDILLNPNGTLVPTTVYSSPSSFGMGSAFCHIWLAERGDLFDPLVQAGAAYLLPMPAGTPNYLTTDTRALKGEHRLLTLFTRTGQVITNQPETFDANIPGLPFLAPQQGIRGDTR
jgi:hypothetical protein